MPYADHCLPQATSHLVNALKTDAESQDDSEQQKKLLAAAKMLADATARMVEAAKVGALRVLGLAGDSLCFCCQNMAASLLRLITSVRCCCAGLCKHTARQRPAADVETGRRGGQVCCQLCC